MKWTEERKAAARERMLDYWANYPERKAELGRKMRAVSTTPEARERSRAAGKKGGGRPPLTAEQREQRAIETILRAFQALKPASRAEVCGMLWDGISRDSPDSGE